MSCAHCLDAEKIFDHKNAEQVLDAYRSEGPNRTTRLLIEALKREGIQGSTLVDVGGGIGVIAFELMDEGLKWATLVEASSASLAMANQEAARRGLEERLETLHGDYVELAASLPPAEVITLDRVVCCYPDMARLVGYSSAQAGRLYALVFPRRVWWVRIGVGLLNLWLWLRRSAFRAYVHPPDQMEALIRGNGFERRYAEAAGPWQVVVYRRVELKED